MTNLNGSIERITFTPASKMEHGMIENLAQLKGSSMAAVVTQALNQWLKQNYTKEIDLIEFYSNKEEN